jgi:hypothetical protein
MCRRLALLTLCVLCIWAVLLAAKEPNAEQNVGGECEWDNADDGAADFLPKIMVWVDIDECEMETEECSRNDGPHPVVSFDTSGMDPAHMLVHIVLDGRFMLALSEPSGEASMIMRSPHELHAPTSGDHAVEARIVSRSNDAVIARDVVAFTFDLRDPSRNTTERRAPCPIMPGSPITFDYRGGDGHGTHQPVLLAAFHATIGPVIEFGMGHFSTPMLHELCRAHGRQLVSMDTAAPWVEQFRHLENDFHTIMHVEAWEHVPEVEALLHKEWGLVFIDQHPETARIQVHPPSPTPHTPHPTPHTPCYRTLTLNN